MKAVSRIFESAAEGGPHDAPPFFNAAMVVCTDLSPEELRTELRQVEDVLGRVRTDDKNAPRTIDIDLSYFAGLVKDFGEWKVPDPDAPPSRTCWFRSPTLRRIGPIPCPDLRWPTWCSAIDTAESRSVRLPGSN